MMSVSIYHAFAAISKRSFGGDPSDDQSLEVIYDAFKSCKDVYRPFDAPASIKAALAAREYLASLANDCFEVLPASKWASPALCSLAIASCNTAVS